MKFDEILAMKPPETPDEIRAAATAVLAAEDLSADERDAFECGYMFGLMYGAASDKAGAATELLLRMHEL